MRRGHDPDLIIRLPDGSHAAVAMSSTDYTPAPDLEPLPGPPPLLDIDGLRQVVQFMDRLRQAGRYPDAAQPPTCSVSESSYD